MANRLIHERFGRFWGTFPVGDLVLVNGLTIVTEFIGIALAGSYFGVPRWLSVTGAAALLVAFVASGSFRRWERWMYALIAANVVLIGLALYFAALPGAGKYTANRRSASRGGRRSRLASNRGW